MITKGEWKAGFNPGVTGPTTPTFEPFCGGEDWPYRTINTGMETIALVPAQAKNHLIGQDSEPMLESAEANANLIAAAPDLYEALKAIKTLPDFALPGKLYKQVCEAIAKAEGK